MQKKTVFVLGAGVSMQYGFPSGAALLDDICKKLMPSNYSYEYGFNGWVKHEIDKGMVLRKQATPCVEVDMQSMFDALIVLGFKAEYIEDFRNKLYHSDTNSIDSFLRNNKQYKDVGKAAIAHSLMRCEDEKLFFDRNRFKDDEEGPSVYKYLWSHMLDMVREVGIQGYISKKMPSFVTFNYDRSLEQYFARAMSSYSGDSLGRMEQLASKVLHVHGKLGKFTPCADHSDGWSYGGGIEKGYLESAIESLRVIGDDHSVDEVVEVTRFAMRNAEQIVFLGFAYNEDNLRTLFGNERVTAEMFGTSYGMTHNEVEDLCENLRQYSVDPEQNIRIQSKHSHMKAYDYLREVVRFHHVGEQRLLDNLVIEE